MKRELVERIDLSLMRRVSDLSPATQRWLKTAVQSIRTMPAGREERIEDVSPPEHLRRLPEGKSRKKTEKPAPPTLEDVITGKRKLEEAEQYPEIAEELEGIGEVIDMLRDLGESRRKRGEQILRDEILRGREEDEDFSF